LEEVFHGVFLNSICLLARQPLPPPTPYPINRFPEFILSLCLGAKREVRGGRNDTNLGSKLSFHL
jgi:hypothetical protein